MKRHRPTAWDKVRDDYMSEGRIKRLWRLVSPLPGVLKTKVGSQWERTKSWWTTRQPTLPPVRERLTPGAAALIGRFAGQNGVLRMDDLGKDYLDRPDALWRYASELVQHGLCQWAPEGEASQTLYLTNAGYRSVGLLGEGPR